MSSLFIFDMGEVLLFDVQTLPQMADFYSIDYEYLRYDYGLYDIPLMEGFMSAEDYYRHMEIKYSLEPISDNPFVKYFKPHINTFMLNVVARLREKGHRVVVGSNTFAPHWDYVYRYYPELVNSFDALYASHLIHIAKPFTAFWRYIIEKEGFKPEATVFIDDREENIESAKGLGINTFQYLKNDSELDSFLVPWL